MAAGEMGVVLDVRDTPLSVDEVLHAVSTPAAGGIALFVGVVRDSDAGREVCRLGYTAHPTAQSVLRHIAQRVALSYPGIRLAAVHRTGDLAVGDLAVVVAAAAEHRADAFDACRALIDTLKLEVPIWKDQVFTDGGQEWVGSP